MNSTAILGAQEGMCFMFVVVFQHNKLAKSAKFDSDLFVNVTL